MGWIRWWLHRSEVLPPWAVGFTFSACETAAWHMPDATIFRGRKKLLEFGSLQKHFLTIYPLNTIPTHREFLKPKYGRIESITLDSWGYDLPQTEEDVWGQLEALPAGLTKDPSYGLGVQNDYRIIVQTIKQIPEVKHIVLAGDMPTSLDGDLYYLNLRDFDGLRRAINRIKVQKLREGAQDKLVLVRKTLLSNVLPHRFVEMKRAYKPDTIFRLIEAKASVPSLSKADRFSAVKLVEQSKRKLAEESPAELLQLKNDLELVSLEALIARFEEMLGKRLVENQWQKLFNENPFILNMAFGYPVVKIRDQAHVGGQTLAGSGSTITDFLIKHKMSNNIAMFEIKTPQTSLLNKTVPTGCFKRFRIRVSPCARKDGSAPLPNTPGPGSCAYFLRLFLPK